MIFEMFEIQISKKDKKLQSVGFVLLGKNKIIFAVKCAVKSRHTCKLVSKKKKIKSYMNLIVPISRTHRS